MKILYCCLGEVVYKDACEILMQMGHQVKKQDCEIKDYSIDHEFSRTFQKWLEEECYDSVFSFYFVPLIAKIAYAKKIRYVVWLFDGMPLTLYSQMVFSPYNYIFTFDSADYENLKKLGVSHVWHLPLGVNFERVQEQVMSEKAGEEREHEVTFLGTLYNNYYDFLSQVTYMPERLRGYIDAMALSQIQLPGTELIEEMMTDELVEELKQYVSVETGGEYMYTEKDIFLNMMRKHVTVKERQKLLQMLSEHYLVALYSDSNSEKLPRIKNHGYAEYYTEMPCVFAHSKINLNITHRGIKSGISLRALDIMAAGGFLLSNIQPELCSYFEPGKDFAVYENPEDLVRKVAYYLQHEEERKEIAENGRRKVAENFTYEKQFEKLFQTLENEMME